MWVKRHMSTNTQVVENNGAPNAKLLELFWKRWPHRTGFWSAIPYQRLQHQRTIHWDAFLEAALVFGFIRSPFYSAFKTLYHPAPRARKEDFNRPKIGAIYARASPAGSPLTGSRSEDYSCGKSTRLGGTATVTLIILQSVALFAT